MKEKLLALVESHPELLGFRGQLTYMICEVIPENCDLSGRTLEDVMDWLPEEHLEYMYNVLKGECA